MILFTLGLKKNENEIAKVNQRKAVRAVILNGDKILLIQTNKGDLKFPGGGVKEGENHESTLIGEVMEETGYIIKQVNERIGEIIQRSYDEFDEGSIFEMVSYYYVCEVSENKGFQKLDEYEKALDFSPVWVDICTAIDKNQSILKETGKDINPWVYRETAFLEELKSVIKPTIT